MIIYTNNTKKSEWDKILKEAKPYLDKLNQQVEVREVHLWKKISTIEKNGKKEINFNFLKTMKPNKGFFVFHESDFDQEGIHGRYWHNTGIAYIERKLSTKSRKYKEFKYDVARTLVHELLHYVAETKGMEDETHYYQERDDLMAFVDKLTEPQDPLRELYLKLIPLLQKLLGNLQEEAEICDDFDYILHHSATARDYTRRATIESHFNGSYKSFDWYHYIILPNETIDRNRPPHERGTVDICVVGDFTNEKPTQYQIDKVLEITNGEFITHNEAGLRGIATKSTCPGNLLQYIKGH